MLTVYILASRRDERHVKELWIHTAMMRRQMRDISWISPLYVEDIVQSAALVELPSQPYVVLGCMSNTFVSELLDQPYLRDMVEEAVRKIPILISPCVWDAPPCPFANKQAAWRQPVASANRDDVLYQVVVRLREALEKMLQEVS